MDMLEARIKEFIASEETEICFSGHPSNERAEIHELASKFGLYHITKHEQYQNILYISKTPLVELEKIVLRERFIRDTKLPIAVAESPYWEYLLDLLDPYFSTIKKFNQFQEAVKACGGLIGYRKKSEEVRDRILNSVKENAAYQDFVKKDIKSKLPKRFGSVYTQEGDNKLFVSLDIIAANFTAVKKYNYEIFNVNTWSELMNTGYPIIDENKHLRQTILGKLNSKKFAILYGTITADLLKSISILNSKIVSIQMDEIIFETSVELIQEQFESVKAIVEKLGMGQDVRVTAFRLIKLPTHKPYFVKEFLDPESLQIIKIDFKCIPSHHMAQCIKKYLGEPIVYEDRKYSYEGHVSTFDKSIFK